MKRRVSADERLQVIGLLLVPAFVGHFIQLASEDVPWAAWAWPRYFVTPGWHLYLPWWIPAGIAVALACSVLALGARRTRPWFLAVIALYALHYLTYPYRIRNHMTTMLSELTVLGGVWILGWLSGATDLRGRGPRARLVDRYAGTGIAVILCVIYAFAALHQINDNFLAQNDTSDAVQGLTTFWIYGDLGSVPPDFMIALATYGTVVIEALAPIVALTVPRLRYLAVTVLFLFHFPHVAVMNVADYPMIASTFYPALFSRAHFRILLRNARINRYTLGGAALGAAGQLWFMPYVGALMVFGIFVMALWGWAMGAMLRATVVSVRRRRRSRLATAPASATR